MGIIKTWVEINESAGEGVASTIIDTAQGIAGAACDVLSKYPNAFPLVPYARGFVRGACGDRLTLPDVDTPPFQGGQCPGVSYDVVTEENTTGTVIARNHRVAGPVNGINYQFAGNVTQDGVPVTIWLAQLDPISNSSVTGFFSVPRDVPPPGQFTVKIVSVSRVDGLADDCGDPPLYPPDPPIDPADFSPTIVVNNYDEAGDVVSTNNYQIDLNGSDLIEFDFSVRVGGTAVEVDVGGINIGGGQIGEGQKRVEELEKPRTCETEQEGFDSTKFEEEEIEESTGFVEEVERLAWVAIEIVELQTKGKTIVHKQEQDNDYFAGYHSFTVKTDGGTWQLPPDPIRKKRSIFKAPFGATGFRAYALNGARLRAIVYREKVEAPR
jgi:hypothetical protein